MSKLKDTMLVLSILFLFYALVFGIGDRDGGIEEIDAKMEKDLYERQIYQEGKDEGYHFGYEAGYDAGFKEGREMGYDDGYEACLEQHGLND